MDVERAARMEPVDSRAQTQASASLNSKFRPLRTGRVHSLCEGDFAIDTQNLSETEEWQHRCCRNLAQFHEDNF